MNNNNPHYVVIGLALFSMFFGSGNLIYPLVLGREAGSLFLISSIAFIISAVLIPCLGILAISLAEGDYRQIFGSFFGARIQTVLIFIVLLSFIPFGSGPRCVVLAHASLNTFIPMPPLWLFGLIFLSATAYIVYDRRRLLDNLGKILTPLLLITIAIMVISALINGTIDAPKAEPYELFMNSLFEGYNTQDLLSSLFFSSSLIFLVRGNFSNKKDMVLFVLKGALVGVILLATLYFFLITASSLHREVLTGHSGIELVSILAKHTLGNFAGTIAGITVVLACFTTSVALVWAFEGFLAREILGKRFAFLAIPLSLLSIYLTSLLQFEGIMAIVSPMMKLIYPLILILVIKYLWDLSKKRAINN